MNLTSETAEGNETTVDTVNHDHCDQHDDFGGLERDVLAPTRAFNGGAINRRRALTLLGAAGAGVALAACKSSSTLTTSSVASSTSSTGAATGSAAATGTNSGPVAASAGTEIPTETNGPFPADGTNGPNILETSGVVRSDITTSIADFSGTAAGIPTTIDITIADAQTGKPIPGAAVYIWHCTADGQYSIYQVTDQNYLRGVQVADDSGVVRFKSVFAGCYDGRWPHVHFEVYDTADDASNGRSARKVSQLAFPKEACEAVYADSKYGNSASNLSRLSLETDMVFRDGWTEELATVSGDNAAGYTVSLLARV